MVHKREIKDSSNLKEAIVTTIGQPNKHYTASENPPRGTPFTNTLIFTRRGFISKKKTSKTPFRSLLCSPRVLSLLGSRPSLAAASSEPSPPVSSASYRIRLFYCS